MRLSSCRFNILIPLLIFIVLFLFLWRGLYLDPRHLPSTFINKPAPNFSLPELNNSQQSFTKQNLLGHVSLLHVWASWCATCQEEQPFLMDLARIQSVPIYAIDYKDEQNAARQWLYERGNPYRLVGFDMDGKVGINWGVYGTPETFVIDKNGVIRYKVIGALTPNIWQNEVAPLINKLEKQK
jgi:cytochrome c biogenesis protein CcmG, thiol:disulfide interchange protein DsbE